jgi:predicted pyridoxine 5'-phosphate oxidase superfamily flavin-nucleotide-binding protein
MPHAYGDIAFTASVKAAQSRDGSRANYARGFEFAGEVVNRELGEPEAAFIEAQRSFHMATVSETGWPYVQHRGGPKGFLKVLDARTIAFADLAGNRQLISVGNLAVSDKISIILMNYARRVRLKIFGRARVVDFLPDDPTMAALIDPGYKARPQRGVFVTVEAYDWNCPQHIPVRLDQEDVQALLDERDVRIASLQRQLEDALGRPGVTKR